MRALRINWSWDCQIRKVGFEQEWFVSVVVRGRNSGGEGCVPSIKPKRCCPFKYGTICAFHNK